MSHISSSQLISITIKGLHGIHLTRMDGVVIGQTATVSFGGSIANMQIGTSRLCSVSGYPVIESRPVLNDTVGKIAWPTEFSHLTLTTEYSRRIMGGWSDALPEILEISVRFGTASGICHLIVGKELDQVVQTLPIRSQDPAFEDATLRIRIVRDDNSLLPSITQSSTQSSGESVTLDLRTLVGLPTRNVHVRQPPTSCSAFSFREIRRAVLACQPNILDDTSTIATHDSWDL